MRSPWSEEIVAARRLHEEFGDQGGRHPLPLILLMVALAAIQGAAAWIIWG